jgi:hypothetical protein
MPAVVDKRKRTKADIDYAFIDREDISGHAKLIYMILARHEGEKEWPGIDTIARKAGIHHNTAEKAIRELELLKIVGVQRRSGTPNKYLLLDKSLWLTVPPGSTVADGSVPPSSTVADGSVPPGSTVIDAPAVQGFKDLKNTHTTASDEACASGDPFEKFWAVCHPLMRKNKKRARKAWSRLKPNSGLIAVIMEQLERQKQTSMWKRNVGVPYAENWITDERWTDGIDPVVESPSGAGPEIYIAIGEFGRIVPREVAKLYGVDLKLCHMTFNQDCAELIGRGIDPTKYIILRYRPDKNYTLPTTKGEGFRSD